MNAKAKAQCVGCKWADWQMTANGRLNPKRHGACTYTMTTPPIPLSFGNDIKFAIERGNKGKVIWADDGNMKDCPTFEVKT